MTAKCCESAAAAKLSKELPKPVFVAGGRVKTSELSNDRRVKASELSDDPKTRPKPTERTKPKPTAAAKLTQAEARLDIVPKSAKYSGTTGLWLLLPFDIVGRLSFLGGEVKLLRMSRQRKRPKISPACLAAPERGPCEGVLERFGLLLGRQSGVILTTAVEFEVAPRLHDAAVQTVHIRRLPGQSEQLPQPKGLPAGLLPLRRALMTDDWNFG